MRINLLMLCRLGLVVVLALSALPAVADHHEEAKTAEGMGEMSPDQAAMMEKYMQAGTPGSEHEMLSQMVGTYEMTVKAWMDPNGEPMVSTGTAEREMILDGRVLQETVEADMMGQPFRGVGHSGYDNVTDMYWSTWADNMSTGLTMLEGTMDMESHTAVWEGTSPDPIAGKRTPMKIEAHFADGKEVNTFYMSGPGGEMVKSMEITYVKK